MHLRSEWKSQGVLSLPLGQVKEGLTNYNERQYDRPEDDPFGKLTNCLNMLRKRLKLPKLFKSLMSLLRNNCLKMKAEQSNQTRKKPL